MDSFTETTLLLVLGLVCVATLVLLPIKEGEDASGIRAGIQARVRGSRSHGGQGQVSRRISWKRLTHSRENMEELSQQF